jgi:hypothetical protein
VALDIVLGPASNGNANPPTVERIDVEPAVKKSRVSKVRGRPYSVQFWSQGAFDAWKQALGSGQEWTRWPDLEATCWSIRQEIQQQLNDMRAGRHDSTEARRTTARHKYGTVGRRGDCRRNKKRRHDDS